jgi:hypothetical protein
MKVKTALVLVVIVINSFSCFSQLLEEPGCIRRPLSIYSTGIILSQQPGGPVSLTKWIVYAGKNDIKGYKDESLRLASSTFRFMDAFYVIAELSEKVKVVEAAFVTSTASLLEGWEEHVHWFDKGDILLWSGCLVEPLSLAGKYKVEIEKKAVIMDKPDIGNSFQIPVGYYSSPGRDISNKIGNFTNFEILYIYKEEPDYYLVGREPFLDRNDYKNEIKGWVSIKNAAKWNSHLALEMNWEHCRDRSPVKVFSDLSVAELYCSNPNFPPSYAQGKIIFQEDSNNRYCMRETGYLQHFYLLDQGIVGNDQIMKVGVAGGTEISGHNSQYQNIIREGYTCFYPGASKWPLFNYVALINQRDLYSLKYALEKLIPTKVFCMGNDQYRSYLQDTWEEILVKQLKYFSKGNEQINNLTLYDLSVILTGWGGKEKYKAIEFRDIIDPVKFPNDQLYEYLIDWMITKGHIQSIFEGRNMLTKDYFSDHIACYAMEYIMYSTGNFFEDELYNQIENELIDQFAGRFASFNQIYTYNDIPQFRIPIGETEAAAETYYWLDTRIFPTRYSEGSEIALEVARRMMK